MFVCDTSMVDRSLDLGHGARREADLVLGEARDERGRVVVPRRAQHAVRVGGRRLVRAAREHRHARPAAVLDCVVEVLPQTRRGWKRRSDRETKRRRDGATERQRDGATERRSDRATESTPPQSAVVRVRVVPIAPSNRRTRDDGRAHARRERAPNRTNQASARAKPVAMARAPGCRRSRPTSSGRPTRRGA